jgi:hypothetical protein
MPFIDPLPSPNPADMLKRPSLPLSPDSISSPKEIPIQPIQFPSLPFYSPSTPMKELSPRLNPYELIAMKAREASKQREAKRKADKEARERESSQSSGMGSGSESQSSTMISSGESSLGSIPELEPTRKQSTSTSTPSLPRNGVPPQDGHTTENVLSSPIWPSRPVNRGHAEIELVPHVQSYTSTNPAAVPINKAEDGPIEEDDDADLKRLMNQAKNMLHISDNSQTGGKSQSNTNKPVESSDVTRLDEARGVEMPVLADANDERRYVWL